MNNNNNNIEDYENMENDNYEEESVTKSDYISHALNKYKEPKRIKIEKEQNEVDNQNNPANKKDDKKKPDPKKAPNKNENEVLDETNSVEVNKMNVFKFAPILFGLNNVKIV